VDAVRTTSSRRAREARDAARTARAEYDLQHEAWDLALADQVERAMGELSDDERRAIELAYFDGRTYREVARVLEQPEGTVKSRIRSGMRRLRDALVDAGVRGVDA
jgi:RNA polymerase sigma-70 factor (ECF subfamily)